MGKHGKDVPVPLYIENMAIVGKVLSSEASNVAESVKVIDDSIKKHPIPPATVKE